MANFPANVEKPQPTRVRYVIIALTTLMAIVLYLHRYCLSFAERYIKDDLGLSNDQIGILFGAFFVAYGIGQVPSGWFGDRWGVRRTLTLYIAIWSLFAGLMGAATGFLVVLALRLGCGLAQAGAYPAAASVVGRWVPIAGRGFASSVVALGGRLGGAAAPVLTAFLLVAFVPSDVPATLSPDDLLDGPTWCRRLTTSDGTPESLFAQRVLAMLPAEARRAVWDMASLPPGTPPIPQDIAALTDGLNEVLSRRDLCGAEELRTLPLPNEARKLAEQPRADLTAAQVQRLNRLVLDSAFPNYLKKLYGRGWRPVIAVYDLAGLAVALLFWLGFRDSPATHPRCNAEEVALIAANRATTVAETPAPLPLRALLRSWSMWMVSLGQVSANFGWLFLVTWLPRYLAEVHRVPVLERGGMAGVPLAVGMFGMLAGGWLTDRLTRAVGLRWGRALPLLISRVLAMLAFAACVLFHSPWPVVLALAVVAVTTDLGTPAIWAYNQDVGGRSIGAVLGWNNMWGNLGAALSPWGLALVIEHFGWNAMFLTCAASYLVSALTSLGVDARERLAE